MNKCYCADRDIPLCGCCRPICEKKYFYGLCSTCNQPMSAITRRGEIHHYYCSHCAEHKLEDRVMTQKEALRYMLEGGMVYVLSRAEYFMIQNDRIACFDMNHNSVENFNFCNWLQFFEYHRI